MDQRYRRQVKLLLTVLPEVAKERCFALHGGTAINLFIRDMPRLSVDIDLTYLAIEERETTINHIREALERIVLSTKRVLPKASFALKPETGKLIVSSEGATIKVEVNLTGRGTYASPEVRELCEQAQEMFDTFCEIQVVPLGQLYGGKICAALDRQHPRDLFDIKYMLANDGFPKGIKEGFFLCLLGSERPMHEILSPNMLDQQGALSQQFAGMTTENFTYEEYEKTRVALIDSIHQHLTEGDKEFLLNFQKLEPIWEPYNFKAFPNVKWKMLNLQKLKEINAGKFKRQHELLKEVLYAK